MQAWTRLRDALPALPGLLPALALLGGFSQITQALLIRELLVAFGGNELGIGAFYGSWLFWMGLGGVAATRIKTLPPRERLFPLALPLLPLLLALQMAAIRVSRLVLNLPAGELIPLDGLLLVTVITTLPTGFLLGLLYPVACQGIRQEHAARGITWLYLIESVGAFAGAALFTFLLVEHLGAWRTLGVLALITGAVTHRAWRRPIWPVLVAGLGLLVAFTPWGGWLERAMETTRFTALHPGLTLLHTVESRQGHTAVARLGQQTSLLEEGRVGESHPDTRRVAIDAAYFQTQARGAGSILLIGGWFSGLAAELLAYPTVTRLDLVVSDEAAFQGVRPHLSPEMTRALQDPRLRLVFQDPREFLHQRPMGDPYDLVLTLTPDPATARLNRLFTLEYYQHARTHLRDSGVFCTRIAGAANYMGQEVGGYAGSVYATLRQVFAHLTVVPGESATLCASPDPEGLSSDPVLLAERFAEIKPPHATLSPTALHEPLSLARSLAACRELAAEHAPVNTDDTPVTFFLNTLLWSRVTGSNLGEGLTVVRRLGPWPYLMPLFALLVVAGFRRGGSVDPGQGAMIALAALGFASMALQVLLLHGYQAQVGFVFSRVALLNGTFMTGMALGAALLSGVKAGRGRAGLLWALGLTLLFTLALPFVISSMTQLPLAWREPVYLALALVNGLLTATGFPLAVNLIASPRVEAVAGAAEAADHFGAALGGLLAGALMIPILGNQGAARVVAAALFTAMILLLLRPTPGAARPATLPWGRWSPLLAGALLTLLPLALMVRATAPGPQVTFSEQVLADISGLRRFEHRSTPFPHDWATRPGEPPREGVILATAAVAQEIKGFAGPINLLVAVDQGGRLLGVRYVESRETPRYIEGMQPWLDRLVGRELGSAPLLLEQVDALTGATLSARAALASINRAVERGMLARWQRGPAWSGEAAAPVIDTRLLAVAGVLGLGIIVMARQRPRERLGFLLLTLLTLGVWQNALVSELDLGGLSLGQGAGWDGARLLLVGGAVALAVAGGPLWCGYLCPFGAGQELLSRLGQRLGWRLFPNLGLEARGRNLKYLLLAVLLAAYWLTGDAAWLGANPMQHAFHGPWSGWMAGVTGVVLVSSLVWFRPWCRYLCPAGACLNLGNRIALLERLLPRRRVERCDLGVVHEGDVECLRCYRCRERELAWTAPPPLWQRLRNPLFVLTLALMLAGLILHLGEQGPTPSGWRVIDTRKVYQQIDSGRLSEREAEWYGRE